jgi:hypothetical protein
MAALVGSTVQRTLSGVRRERTGLPGVKTHEPGSEDFGDLGESLISRQGVGINHRRSIIVIG